MKSIHRIALSGGPSAGKTTALAKISDRFEALGFHVYRVPEAATLLITGGFNLRTTKPDHEIQLQGALIRLQMALEDSFYAAAELLEKSSVILCDRGLMDSAAFVSREAWQAILDENGWSVVGLMVLNNFILLLIIRLGSKHLNKLDLLMKNF